MPQLLAYVAKTGGGLPQRLVLAMAATMLLYRGGVIELSDDPASLAWFASGWGKVAAGEWTVGQLVQGWLANTALWGRDMNEVNGLAEAVSAAIERIDQEGIRQVLA
jgi:tagaturonate reductase